MFNLKKAFTLIAADTLGPLGGMAAPFVFDFAIRELQNALQRPAGGSFGGRSDGFVNQDARDLYDFVHGK